MSHFQNLPENEKLELQEQLANLAQKFGGQNPFLNFLEDIRSTKPHPLISAYCDFKTKSASIYWEKVIFKDKLELLLKLRLTESQQDNLLPDPKQKGYKKALNLVKTLRPILFELETKESQESTTIEPLIIYSKDKTKLNPLFDALFFLSVENVKRILSYKPKAT